MAKTKVDKPKVAAKTDVKAPIAKAKRTPKKKEVVESKPVTSPVAVGGSAAYSKPKEKPKGAKSAYMHFQQAVYEETVKKIGSNNPRFVMTATGRLYRRRAGDTVGLFYENKMFSC